MAGDGGEERDFMYYCPFCYEVTRHYVVPPDAEEADGKAASKQREEMEFMQCDSCGNQGSTKPHRCSKCNQNVHVYKNPVGDVLKNTIPLLRKLGQEQLKSFLPIESAEGAANEEDEPECAECIKGFGPKDVISVNVMNCIFCGWTIQTFYEFAQKMKCTNCQNFRTRLGPHNDVNEQWCSKCNSIRPELWTQNKIEQCRECWKKELQGKRRVLKVKKNQFEEDQCELVDESTLFTYECGFCGVDEQKWRDLGDGTSQCQGCKVIGTNSGWETCPSCNDQNYIYVINRLRKCFACWNKGDAGEEDELQQQIPA